MSKDGKRDTGLQITLPDPDDKNLLHVFPVDPEKEESLVHLWYSLVKLYGEEGEEIAARLLGKKALSRAICGILVGKGRLIRLGDGVYGVPE